MWTSDFPSVNLLGGGSEGDDQWGASDYPTDNAFVEAFLYEKKNWIFFLSFLFSKKECFFFPR
jgi:hypothetical protein